MFRIDDSVIPLPIWPLSHRAQHAIVALRDAAREIVGAMDDAEEYGKIVHHLSPEDRVKMKTLKSKAVEILSLMES